MSAANLIKDKAGKLETHVWPGGYTLVFLAADGGTLCGACANGANGSEATTDADAPDGWRIIGAYVHWEGEPMACDHCGAGMPSEYGVPDSD